jgi:predicted Fe-Mo cluster-binding NifX family protein
MKIAITTQGIGLNSEISPVFGRSPYIIFLELENNEIMMETAIENPARLEKGAGNLLADFLSNNRVEVVISGEMGPVAFYILKNESIRVYKGAAFNAAKNLELLTSGKLKEVTSLSSGYPK